VAEAILATFDQLRVTNDAVEEEVENEEEAEDVKPKTKKARKTRKAAKK